MSGKILATYAEPFEARGVTVEFERGVSLADIVAAMPVRGDFAERGTICINGEVTVSEYWRNIKPHGGTHQNPVAVTLHYPLGDPGSVVAGTKAVLTQLGILGTTASGALGLTALGQFIVGIGLSVGASLIGQALSKPPAPNVSKEESSDRREAASVEGNILEPGVPIPRVCGTRKVYPPLASEPVITLDGDDEVAEAVFVLTGPHELTDIRVNDAPIEEAENVEYQTREGWVDDVPVELVTRQGRQNGYNAKLSTHVVRESSPEVLDNQAVPENSLPKYQIMATRESPDEAHINIIFPQGLVDTSDPDNQVAVPFRLAIKKRGEANWINLPDIHFTDAHIGERKAVIILRWGAAPEAIPAVPTSQGWYFASKFVPAQTIVPGFPSYSADSYFSASSGSDVLYQGVEGSTNIRNVSLGAREAVFYLDEGTFPKGIYDIRIKRGMWYDTDDFSKSAQTYDSGSYDLFGYYLSSGVAVIKETRDNAGDDVYVRFVQSIWNEHPIQAEGLAVIAIKVRNQRIDKLSTVASGYVKDWDGSAWANWTTTSNPAAHYRDVLVGEANFDPLPVDLLDDDSLVDWRSTCATNGYECNAVFEGARTQEALDVLASCGYARPYQSEVWGVVEDRDRSAESPIQIFSPRNMSGFRWEKGFIRRPDGFRVAFRDDTGDYGREEIIVYRRDYNELDEGRLEQIAYVGITDPDKLRTRALFDLDQSEQRAAFYSFEASADAIVCRRNDLIGITHDQLSDFTGYGRIVDVTVDDGDVTEIALDSEVQVYNEDDMSEITDMSAITDFSLIGLKGGIAIRRKDASVSTHAISNPTGLWDHFVLSTPIAVATTTTSAYDEDDSQNVIGPGCMVTVGPLSKEYGRYLVHSIEYAGQDRVRLTAVDEAPDLVRT
ncbi:MAG: hypothetical protein AB7L41_06225 [Flavobacteriaceae bacterium]